jgi:DNA transformation protein
MTERAGQSRAIETLRNIGPKTAWRLREVGIGSEVELRALGAVAAYRRVRHFDPRFTTRNCLYALEGALRDLPWTGLPSQVKDRLRREAEG